MRAAADRAVPPRELERLGAHEDVARERILDHHRVVARRQRCVVPSERLARPERRGAQPRHLRRRVGAPPPIGTPRDRLRVGAADDRTVRRDERQRIVEDRAQLEVARAAVLDRAEAALLVAAVALVEVVEVVEQHPRRRERRRHLEAHVAVREAVARARAVVARVLDDGGEHRVREQPAGEREQQRREHRVVAQEPPPRVQRVVPRPPPLLPEGRPARLLRAVRRAPT